jgi:hypothetical protein
VNQDYVGHRTLAFLDGFNECKWMTMRVIGVLRHTISFLKSFHAAPPAHLPANTRQPKRHQASKAISLLRAGKSNKMYLIATYFVLQTSILS